MTECGHDVVILFDSITRPARAHNTVVPSSGKSCRVVWMPMHCTNPSVSLVQPAKSKTAAPDHYRYRVDRYRIEKWTRLSSKNLRGTGNMELQLDRKLSNKRIYPAIDVPVSGTRREDLLMKEDELCTCGSCKYMSDMNSIEAMEFCRAK